jgi:two-component system, LytTR family, response regulator
MTRIRTLVVDDEPIARARVLSLLRDEPDVDIVGECASGAQAVSVINAQSPDLVFLDIQMPEMDGFEVARALQPERMPALVFVTAFDQYAVRAFECHALDYLLKPFSVQRFKSALSHARQQLAQRQATTLGRQLLEILPDMRPREPARDRLVVRSSGRVYFVRIADIDWCEAAGNYVSLHVGTQSHLTRETMSRLEAQLDPHQFVRIHRSTIVNVDRVQELRSSFNGEHVLLLRDGTRLTLSRGYRDALQARLGTRNA